MKQQATPVEQRQFLLTAAAWQDTLLQSYRSLHVTMQGSLVTAWVIVLAVQLTGAVQYASIETPLSSHYLSDIFFNGIFTALLVFLFWFQRKTALKLKGVVKSRTGDIDYWHRIIIMSENEFEPSQRAFTSFKTWQHAHHGDIEPLMPKFMPQEGIGEELAAELIGKGFGHTRQVLDIRLLEHLQYAWWVILFASVITTLWFVRIGFN